MSLAGANTIISHEPAQAHSAPGDGSGVADQSELRSRLRLLSYNIQTGISTRRYREYLTHSWKHILPHRMRQENLANIAALVADYDLVGLQEVDAGSLRTGFIDQTEFLASRAGFPYWTSQTNRRIGKFAQHSIGILSRFPFGDVTEIKLPGRIPGRGALMVRLGGEAEPVIVIIAHLALGRRARLQQLDFLGRLAGSYRHVILMADLNCPTHSPEMSLLLRQGGLRVPGHGLCTFPSWRPIRNIDHILLSASLQAHDVDAPSYPFSDHLPIAIEVTLPPEIFVPDSRLCVGI